MNTVDIVLGVLLLVAFGLGLRKGFILQLASLVALILGIYGAIKLTDAAVELFVSKTETTGDYLPLIMFCSIFILIVVLVHVLAWFLEKALKLVTLNWANKIAGGIFSMAKWAMILSVIISSAEKFGLFGASKEGDKYRDALLYEPLRDMGGFVLPPLEDFYAERFGKGEEQQE